MWEWRDQLKLGKGSAFVKKDLRPLPLTDVEFEAEFFLDPVFSSKRRERWLGIVIEQESGGVLAMEDVQLPPPTVNYLANLLAHAMLRPLDGRDRQRPSAIHLRDRPQWRELLPHLQQLGIEVVLGDDLPRFDEAVMDWMKTKKKQFSQDEVKAALRKPFPERRPSWFTEAMALMEWAHAMFKGAYPSRRVPVPSYDPMTTVPVHLAADELEAILTRTNIAKMKKLRPRLETMAAENKAIDLDIHDWSTVVSALCATAANERAVRKHLLGIARRIAGHLAQALDIEAPPV